MNGLSGPLGGEVADEEVDGGRSRAVRVGAREKVAIPRYIAGLAVDLLIGAGPSVQHGGQLGERQAGRVPVRIGAQMQQQRRSGKQQHRDPEAKALHARRLLIGKRVSARWMMYRHTSETRKITHPENS